MRKKLAIISVTVVFILSIIRIIMVNSNAEIYKLKIEKCERNVTVECDEFSYKVIDYEILNPYEIEQKYQYKDDAEPSNLYYAIVNLEYTYKGNNQGGMPPIYELQLETGAWSNGINASATSQINSGDMMVSLNETKAYKIVFDLRKIMFSKSGWKDVCTKNYQLVMMNYPRVIKFDLR